MRIKAYQLSSMSKNRDDGDDSEPHGEWGTPPEIWEPIAEALNGFDLDPASGAEPESIGDVQFTEEDDGLAQDWFGNVWLNPPYGRGENARWAEKVYKESQRREVTSITALVPASTETQWFQNYYAEGDVFTFLEGRVRFLGGDSAAPFSSVIVTFGPVTPAYLDALDKMGQMFVRVRAE